MRSLLSSPYRLRLRWDRSALREYTRFSWPLFVGVVSTVLMIQVPVSVSARLLGVAAVGGLALATNISQFTTRVDDVVTQTLYPAICAVQDRTDLLFESFWKSNRLALLWAAPLGAAAALFAGDFVHYVIGEKWHFAIPLIITFGINARAQPDRLQLDRVLPGSGRDQTGGRRQPVRAGGHAGHLDSPARPRRAHRPRRRPLHRHRADRRAAPVVPTPALRPAPRVAHVAAGLGPTLPGGRRRAPAPALLHGGVDSVAWTVAEAVLFSLLALATTYRSSVILSGSPWGTCAGAPRPSRLDGDDPDQRCRPTLGRLSTLRRVLERLDAQTVDGEAFELIVAADPQADSLPSSSRCSRTGATRRAA